MKTDKKETFTLELTEKQAHIVLLHLAEAAADTAKKAKMNESYKTNLKELEEIIEILCLAFHYSLKDG